MVQKSVIYQRLQQFSPCLLEIIDQSHLHAGHAGNPNGISGTHYLIKIASTQFENISPLATHRLINGALKTEFANGLHALSIEVVK